MAAIVALKPGFWNQESGLGAGSGTRRVESGLRPCPALIPESDTCFLRVSEVEREVETQEAWRRDRRRRQERAAAELRVVDGRVVRVQQVLDVDADVETPGVEADNLREAHVDLVAPIVGIEPVRAARTGVVRAGRGEVHERHRGR